MKGLIPERVSSAKQVNALQNDAFQEYLAKIIEREDTVSWALRDDEPVVIMALPERTKRTYKFIP
jgi:hypothetical protein